MLFNTTCNATLDEMLIGDSEVPLVGNMTFHTLGLIIAAATALIATLLSLYLIWMHATNYTKPYEQRHIIRILFMIPVYSAASFLAFWFYWHAIYFHVISECYEAFAIASFFALMCHYIAPDLHEQKHYFRTIEPVGWVWPVSWAMKCCGGQRGPWRTPRSGLTWFNIIWTGVYQYCFIRIGATVVAVITQYFGKYCESSNSPVFAHIWVLVIEGAAVTVAMFCLIQFYIQLRKDLAPHSPFLKVLAIKLVIFLSFWQTFLISILTSATFNVVKPTTTLAYPDLKVGIPSLLLCVEMAIFAFLHLFAFPYQPYKKGTEVGKYPISASGTDSPPMNTLGKNEGGLLGWRAIADAMNPWDLVKAFARGMRWLVVGRKHRENDTSYKNGQENDMVLEPSQRAYKGDDHLPIANEFRRSKYGIPSAGPNEVPGEEGAGLITHAQPNPQNSSSGYDPMRQRSDSDDRSLSPDRFMGENPTPGSLTEKGNRGQGNMGMAAAQGEPEPYQSHAIPQPFPSAIQSEAYLEDRRHQRRQQPNPSEQWANSSRPVGDAQEVHNALWGGRPPPKPRDDGNQF
ncbi:Uncharacterized protein BP5553_06822 [Venustampulla echinocandica]|uniref:DUF300-domain-containing protein n=1 Tax=Venustampulla echinocandica TaxID=2656787 RepID=A0A370TL02_9HELO|nr:Uncharacterized protein BP5553_06822 [Venustampulla echinocandica]RDL36210.1 Uncharacterized protein BP5553_06822 [Venustampulla echinocandica]